MENSLQKLSGQLSNDSIFYKKSFGIAVLLFLITFVPCHLSMAGEPDWKEFRGENRNGYVPMPEGMQWVEPQLLWRKNVGSGFSEAVVVSNTIYLMMSEKTDSVSGWEVLVSMDAATGQKYWSSRIDEIFIDEDDWGDGPRSTPAVDETRVYCLSASGKLVAVDRYSGDIVWTVDFVSQFESTMPRWGYSASPLLIDDLVVIEAGGKDGHGFTAFSAATGQLAWSSGDVSAGYNSAMSAQINGEDIIIFVNGSDLFAFTPSGESLWTYKMPLRSPMAMPLFIQPDLLFVSATNDAGSFIVRISGDEPEEVMRSSIMRNDWSSSSYKDGYIYGFNVATLQSMDVGTGQRKWLRRGFGKGSLILIGDRLVVLSDQGTITFAEATPEEYREIAVLEAIEGRSRTAPSFSSGRLYVRNHTTIACYLIMEKQTP